MLVGRGAMWAISSAERASTLWCLMGMVGKVVMSCPRQESNHPENDAGNKDRDYDLNDP